MEARAMLQVPNNCLLSLKAFLRGLHIAFTFVAQCFTSSIYELLMVGLSLPPSSFFHLRGCIVPP